jgi:hypothetical protein
MPIQYDTADAPALVRYSFVGAWTSDELIKARSELIRAGQLTAKSAVLFDLRLAAGLPNLGHLALAMDAERPAVWPICRAFLIATPEQFAEARQLQLLLGPDSVINQVFRDEPAALEWLAVMVGRTAAIKP